MTKFYIFNYLSKKIENFKPLDKTVSLYTCGPTVYDFVHIGNWRTFIFEDILKRALGFNGYQVKHVVNITDIDDKIIKGSKQQGIGYRELGEKYSKEFFADLDKLNIQRADIYPKATEHIPEMIKLIKELIKKGYAYKTDDGVYFAISKFANYGKLSNLKKRSLKAGVRVSADEYEKGNPADFALWKSAKKDEPAWDSPWGKGRPGWHIECSVMSMKYLGKTIDIHAGGIDLLFPHHENEIAQSEAATGKKFVNFWVEGEHLLVESQKMAKSLNNFFRLSDLEKKGFDSLAFRYLCLTAHYRSKLNFSWKSLQSAQNALQKLKEEVANYDPPKIGHSDSESLQTRMSCAGYEDDFNKAISDDLNLPKALAIVWQMVKSNYPTPAKHKSLLYMDYVLGLGLDKVKKQTLPTGAEELIDKRELARQAGNWDKADQIREQLAKIGVEVEDTISGPVWKVKKH